MAPRRKALVWLLRGFGGVTVLALPTLLLPTRWMAGIHEWLGMGEFPASSLVDYLARSLSLLYGLIGLLLLLLASDVERYLPLIRFAGWGSVAAGVCLFVIGVHAGVPAWWWYHEGPSAVAFGCLILGFARDTPGAEPRPPGSARG